MVQSGRPFSSRELLISVNEITMIEHGRRELWFVVDLKSTTHKKIKKYFRVLKCYTTSPVNLSKFRANEYQDSTAFDIILGVLYTYCRKG